MNKSVSSLSHFDPFHDLPENPVVIVYGVRGSGKTVLTHHMLSTMTRRLKTHKAYLFCPTAAYKPEMYYMWPPQSIVTDIVALDAKLGEIIDDQIEALKQGWDAAVSRRKRGRDVEEETNGENKAGAALRPVLIPSEHDRVKSESVTSLNKKRKSEFEVHKQWGTGKAGDGGIRGSFDPAHAERATKAALKRRNAERENSMEAVGAADRSTEKAQALLAQLGSDPDKAAKIRRDLPHVLIMLDDVVNENTIRTSSKLGFLAIAGRHLNMFLVILSQGIAGSLSVPPIVRTQADHIILVAQPKSSHENKMLAENYLCLEGKKKNMDAGLQLLSTITSVKHRAVVMHVSNTMAREWSDFVSVFGPVAMPPCSASFRLGTREQWEEEEEKEEEKHEFDESKIPKPPPKLGDAGRNAGKMVNMGASSIGPDDPAVLHFSF